MLDQTMPITPVGVPGPPPKGELCVLDQTGDTKLIFDPNNADEVEVASDTFRKLKKKGYIAYKVGKDGEKAEVMRDFDATAGKIIMAPPVVGG